ncbi:hypothetical protein HELRODRAFT_192005 [Helobdella robusta]|uniref:Uncharacterized protein n=1 Tax=Helobdella robusta TaxID=6412 RepID=T1FTI1_HELRO|nr:hypothetical protein HELRODRAFT_192005 [Helobdella robusta]ESO03345.1 hypothetical protein HELRODRAFT_192005 [Helobdella robusta]
MGNYNSKNDIVEEAGPSFAAEQKMSTPDTDRSANFSRIRDFIDPRSPTVGIDRTPIQVTATPRPVVVDPRSPTYGIKRTPIVQGFFYQPSALESSVDEERLFSNDIPVCDFDSLIQETENLHAESAQQAVVQENVNSNSSSFIIYEEPEGLETVKNNDQLSTASSAIDSNNDQLNATSLRIDSATDQLNTQPSASSNNNNDVIIDLSKSSAGNKPQNVAKSSKALLSKSPNVRSPLSNKNCHLSDRPSAIVQRKQIIKMAEKMKMNNNNNNNNYHAADDGEDKENLIY